MFCVQETCICTISFKLNWCRNVFIIFLTVHLLICHRVVIFIGFVVCGKHVDLKRLSFWYWFFRSKCRIEMFWYFLCLIGFWSRNCEFWIDLENKSYFLECIISTCVSKPLMSINGTYVRHRDLFWFLCMCKHHTRKPFCIALFL